MFALRFGTRRVASLLVLLVGLSAACDSVAEPEPEQEWTAVTARVQVEHARPGNNVPVRLVNRTAAAWSVSPCPSKLQWLDGGRWRSVALPDCSRDFVDMSGGEPLVTGVVLPVNAEEGVYFRIIYHAWPPFFGPSLAAVEPVEVVSNRFWVPAFR